MKHNCPVCKGKGFVPATHKEMIHQAGWIIKMVQCKHCSNVIGNKRRKGKK